MQYFIEHVQLTEEDVVFAARSHYISLLRRLRWVGILLLILIVALFGVIIIGGPAVIGPWEENLILIIALPAVFVVPIGHYFYTVPRAARRLFLENKTLQRAFAIRWDGESITSDASEHRSMMRWSDFFAYRETSESIILYLSSVQYWVFPKRFLPRTAQENLIGNLDAHSVRRSR